MPTLAVTNLAPATGKTTSVVHLAEQFGSLGARVVIVDFSPDGDAAAAVRRVKTVDLRRALNDGSPLETCLAPTILTGVDLLTLPPGPPAQLFPLGSVEGELTTLVRRLAARYTYVLIDLPPAADLATRTALLTADMAVVPVPLEEESLDDVPKVLELIRAVREGSDSALRTFLFLTLARDSDAARRIEASLRGRYGDLILRTRIPEDPGLNGLLDGQPRPGLPSAGVNAYHQLANEMAHRASAAAAAS